MITTLARSQSVGFYNAMKVNFWQILKLVFHFYKFDIERSKPDYHQQFFFIKIFEPSSWEAFFDGPKTRIIWFSKASNKLSTKGCLGPKKTKSIWFFLTKINHCLENIYINILTFSAIFLVPAFLGKAKIWVGCKELLKASQISFSLPPEPITKIFFCLIYSY